MKSDNLSLMAKAILRMDKLSYRRRRLTSEEHRFLKVRHHGRNAVSLYKEHANRLNKLWQELMGW